MDLSLNLSQELVNQNQKSFVHDDYNKELAFFTAIKHGNVEEVKKLMSPLVSEGTGVLSDKPVNNMKYHLIICITLITRFCMEGGMAPETAYTLSDLYIRRVDKTASEESLVALHEQVIMDYTNRMSQIHNPVRSRQVALASEYIQKNLYTPLSLDDIAAHSNINASYLSTLFKKETGENLGVFIQRCRIEESKTLLKYTDKEVIEIAELLCFSSQSHFISVFKKFADQTPKEYRRKNYKKNFTEE